MGSATRHELSVSVDIYQDKNIDKDNTRSWYMTTKGWEASLGDINHSLSDV